MNRKAVQNDESTGHIRKNRPEVRQDRIMEAWLEAQEVDSNQHESSVKTNWKEIERQWVQGVTVVDCLASRLIEVIECAN